MKTDNDGRGTASGGGSGCIPATGYGCGFGYGFFNFDESELGDRCGIGIADINGPGIGIGEYGTDCCNFGYCHGFGDGAGWGDHSKGTA